MAKLPFGGFFKRGEILWYYFYFNSDKTSRTPKPLPGKWRWYCTCFVLWFDNAPNSCLFSTLYYYITITYPKSGSTENKLFWGYNFAVTERKKGLHSWTAHNLYGSIHLYRPICWACLWILYHDTLMSPLTFEMHRLVSWLRHMRGQIGQMWCQGVDHIQEW